VSTQRARKIEKIREKGGRDRECSGLAVPRDDVHLMSRQL
jgi:hypothetical protein